MKVALTFKIPDVLNQPPLSEEQKEKLSKWIKYGEYVIIEFDLETMEAEVVKNK